jgi:hypothetical protein
VAVLQDEEPQVVPVGVDHHVQIIVALCVITAQEEGHTVIGGLEESWLETLTRLQALLAQRYGIEHPTLQPETVEHPPTATTIDSGFRG